eukprot:2195478-Pleurochrysis_carterae.AAC.4
MLEPVSALSATISGSNQIGAQGSAVGRVFEDKFSTGRVSGSQQASRAPHDLVRLRKLARVLRRHVWYPKWVRPVTYRWGSSICRAGTGKKSRHRERGAGR